MPAEDRWTWRRRRSMAPISGCESGYAGAAPRSPRPASHRSRRPHARRPTHELAGLALRAPGCAGVAGRRTDQVRRAADRIATRSPERLRMAEGHGDTGGQGRRLRLGGRVTVRIAQAAGSQRHAASRGHGITPRQATASAHAAGAVLVLLRRLAARRSIGRTRLSRITSGRWGRGGGVEGAGRGRQNRRGRRFCYDTAPCRRTGNMTSHSRVGGAPESGKMALIIVGLQFRAFDHRPVWPDHPAHAVTIVA